MKPHALHIPLLEQVLRTDLGSPVTKYERPLSPETIAEYEAQLEDFEKARNAAESKLHTFWCD